MIDKYYENYLKSLKSTQKYRILQKDQDLFSTYINFANNDYLGLSNNPLLIQASLEAANKFGVGATGSRLLSGNQSIFAKLESRIASNKKTEAALIFNSGFQANISTLSTLLDSKILHLKPLVFFDRLNHSSLYQAIFLSGAELIRYDHNNTRHLSELLLATQNTSNIHRPKFIVTETIFGMDGDIAPLNEIAKLARKYNAFLYLDEAHATGVSGNGGYGISNTLDLSNLSYLIMGSFSKALGVSGGYIACSHNVQHYLINRSPGFIYSTANSPMVIGAALQAWKLIEKLNTERQNLLHLAEYTRNKLTVLGLDIGASNTHIIPIIFQDTDLTLKIYHHLLNHKIVTSYIRPPTVPPNTSRLRIALNVSHSKNDIDQLIIALQSSPHIKNALHR